MIRTNQLLKFLFSTFFISYASMTQPSLAGESSSIERMDPAFEKFVQNIDLNDIIVGERGIPQLKIVPDHELPQLVNGSARGDSYQKRQDAINKNNKYAKINKDIHEFANSKTQEEAQLLQEQLAQARQEAAAARAERDRQAEENIRLREANRVLEEEKSLLEGRQSDLQEKVETTAREKEVLQRANTSLQTEKGEAQQALRMQIDGRVQEFEKMRQELEQVQTQSKRDAGKEQLLKGQIDQLALEKEELIRTIRDSNEKSASTALQKENQELRQSYDKLQAQLETERVTKAALQDQVNVMIARIEEQEKDLAAQTIRIRTLEGEKQSLIEENQALSQTATSVKKSAAVLQKSEQELILENRRLEEQIEEMSRKIIERQYDSSSSSSRRGSDTSSLDTSIVLTPESSPGLAPSRSHRDLADTDSFKLSTTLSPQSLSGRTHSTVNDLFSS